GQGQGRRTRVGSGRPCILHEPTGPDRRPARRGPPRRRAVTHKAGYEGKSPNQAENDTASSDDPQAAAVLADANRRRGHVLVVLDLVVLDLAVVDRGGRGRLGDRGGRGRGPCAVGHRDRPGGIGGRRAVRPGRGRVHGHGRIEGIGQAEHPRRHVGGGVEVEG